MTGILKVLHGTQIVNSVTQKNIAKVFFWKVDKTNEDVFIKRWRFLNNVPWKNFHKDIEYDKKLYY